jgi:acetylornithine/N-succinyldiaminopimelate aminotransferase
MDASLLRLLLDNRYLPIISPVGVQSDGVALNINADLAAGSIAGSLGASEVLFITDVAGIYRNWPDLTSLIDQISLDELTELAPTFSEGMVPKVKAVITALESGAKRARVIDGSKSFNLEQAFAGRNGGNRMNTQERWHAAMQNNYGVPPITLVKGDGIEVWDEAGRRYLDFLGGIATNILGHAHPGIIKAVSKQVETLSHVSNLYAHKPGVELAEKLREISKDSNAKIFFCNSGAEANEAAIKLSRLTGRTQIVAAHGGFHGRTAGALSITGQPAKRTPFEPLLPDVTFVPYGDSKAMGKAVSKKTALVILEAIQGENGVVVPPPGYLEDVQDICIKYGALFAIDAVQTGMGRTGDWFGYESEGIDPDIVTLAKGLGGGLPLGAMITLGERAPAFKPGEHGSTFGGNPISCAAANASIDFIVKKNLLGRVAIDGEFLKAKLTKIPGVSMVRGRGLLLGIVLESNVAQVVAEKAMGNGLLLNAPAKNVIRIAPALIVSKKELREFIDIFGESLNEVLNG